MTILFIENRYKTSLWESIGREYEKDGHKVQWIVQNPIFKPSFGEVHILPFPKKFKKKKFYTRSLNKIIKGNRGLNYFGIKKDDFIFWYENEIEKKLDELKPDLVFGESTLFHELLVIKGCKKRGILYLHPSSCRYPKNRFSFYKYDTLEPYGSSNEKLPEKEAKETAFKIGKRLALPDYMEVSKFKPSKIDLIKDKIRLTFGYYLGEKYNTPSPFRKWKINRFYSQLIKEWEELAVGIGALKKEFYVMYPMQMQPEANIDVWGFPFNNQAKVLQDILDNLGEDEKLIIKPNPKSKYEICPEVIKFIQDNPDRVIPLKHSCKMDEVWEHIDLVVTVTGTISIECIFDNKPVFLLGQGIQRFQKNCLTKEKEININYAIDLVKTSKFPQLEEDDKISFLNQLISTSFQGTNGDGLHNKRYLDDPENLLNLKNAYSKVVNDRVSTL
ncbi:Capsule polysaccharide modification protein KpsS [Salinimicrobium catena]|uniref:Capsule polysaccharide modification protein KpsS n=1 Tax=Salinimicrobium catena TaxID=390640 RepID=A0A1H5PG39_9FLAO|nr:hypothetical protein [Salinimicrobium catena]SDL80918.1 Capsule polysaccharide modification protein KpsS [Salinimicrobium catena]SEF12088.1 Capsule polysaccharide modification protein KpsS [Salinimicrobium catena]